MVVLHEVLHELRVKKQRGIVLKLDFETAYDKLDWSFIMEVLQKKSFPEKMDKLDETNKHKWDSRRLFQNFQGAQAGGPLVPTPFQPGQ